MIVCAPRSSQMMLLILAALDSMTEASPISERPTMTVLCPWYAPFFHYVRSLTDTHSCAQGIGLYNPLTAGLCRFGHKFSAERLLEPVPADENFAYLYA